MLSGRMATRSPSLMSPMAIPATGARSGTPASMSERLAPPTIPIQDEPLDSRMSATVGAGAPPPAPPPPLSDPPPPHFRLFHLLEGLPGRSFDRRVGPQRLEDLLEHLVHGLRPRLLFVAGQGLGGLSRRGVAGPPPAGGSLPP